MLDFSFAEFALVAIVAILVIDPKDVPSMLRTCMKWFSELRNVTDEVKGTVKSLVDEASITSIADEIEDDLSDLSRMPPGQKYIEDDQGRLQPVYDISDFIKDGEEPKVTGTDSPQGSKSS